MMGNSRGDPDKAALAVIKAVDSKAPPLRLMLGAMPTAYGRRNVPLWTKSLRNGARSEWRPRFDGAEVRADGKA